MLTITVNRYMLTVCFYSGSNAEPPADYVSTPALNMIPPMYLNGISIPRLHDFEVWREGPEMCPSENALVWCAKGLRFNTDDRGKTNKRKLKETGCEEENIQTTA